MRYDFNYKLITKQYREKKDYSTFEESAARLVEFNFVPNSGSNDSGIHNKLHIN